MLDCRICKRNPDSQELRTTIVSQSIEDWLTITVRRPTTVLFRLSTLFVDAANVINPDIERHEIKSAENGRKKVFQTREHLPHLIVNKDKCCWKTMVDHSTDGIRHQFGLLSRHNWANLEIPFLKDLLPHLLNIMWGHRVGLHV